MGREVRRPAIGWQIPMFNGRPKPVHSWTHAELLANFKEYPEDFEGIEPDNECCWPEWPEGTKLGFAIYETISEGTPVTPTFETKEMLIEYLVVHGDYWDQKRGDGPWSRKAAEAIVGGAFAPSFTITSDGAFTSKEILGL